MSVVINILSLAHMPHESIRPSDTGQGGRFNKDLRYIVDPDIVRVEQTDKGGDPKNLSERMWFAEVKIEGVPL